MLNQHYRTQFLAGACPCQLCGWVYDYKGMPALPFTYTVNM